MNSSVILSERLAAEHTIPTNRLIPLEIQNLDELKTDGEFDSGDYLSQFSDWGDTDFANHDPAALEAEFHAFFGAYGLL